MTLQAAMSTPGTTIVTTAETVAANIPPFPLSPPANAQGIVIRGTVTVAPGASTSQVVVKLRTGQNNVSTGQIGTTDGDAVIAAVNQPIPFHFVDTNYGDAALGYTITVVQVGATGNGSVPRVSYDVDVAVP